MAEIFSTTFSFLIVIGILVFVHELGHFLTAKWTGMRADVFSLGMGPRMLGWNKINGFTFGKLPTDIELGTNTDYRLCWFPIGGYVKILGMVDESFDTSFEGKAVEPWEFRAKKNWQKALVLSAGVIMNLILAIVVFWMIPAVFGNEEMQTTTIGWVQPGTVASIAGIEAGDRIAMIDDAPVETWEDVVSKLALVQGGGTRNVKLVRNGSPLSKQIESSAIVRAMAAGEGIGLYPNGTSVQLGAVVSYSPADKGGLKAEDKIVSIDSTPVVNVIQFQRYVRSHSGQPVKIGVDRGGSNRTLDVVVGKDSTIGVELGQMYVGAKKSIPFNVAVSFQNAVAEVGKTVAMIYSSITHIVSGNVSVRQSLGGPIRIAQMASKSQELGAEAFLRFMALISISLAVMNLLPLPGLDGGHLLFVGIEAITRRDIPTNVKMRFQQAGFVILLLLMAFVFYLDLTR